MNATMHSRPWLNVLFAMSSAGVIVLTGCSMGAVSGAGAVANTVHMTGKAYGGQQPIVGATIQLYAVGTSANGSAATPLISSLVTSDQDGSFSITGDYSCTNATQVYLVATGGDPGAGTNPGSALAAALGSCSDLQSNAATTYIYMNELTTVAAAYALAPFEGGSYANVGSSSGFAPALANSFRSAQTLIDTSNGGVPTLPAGLSLPATELNTLGDILAECINSTGGGSTPCGQLFAVTGANNTLDAAFYIAKHPGDPAVTGLWSLVSPISPFQPALSAQPQDFTVAVRYTGTQLSRPTGIAIDGPGNAYITNQTGNSVSAAPPLSPSFGLYNTVAGGMLDGPTGISVDTNGYFWIANTGAANAVEFAPIQYSISGDVTGFASIPTRGIAFSGSAADAPIAVANDHHGNAYFIAPGSNSVFEVSAGGFISSTLTNASLASPQGIALNDAGDITIGTGAGQLCTVSPVNFGSVTPACSSQGNAGAIVALAVNASSTLDVGFAADAGGLGVYAPASGAGPYSGGGLDHPMAIVFDGAGKAFVANLAGIAEFDGATALSPVSGFGSLSAPAGIAVDPSGNVWATNSGDDSISIFIGLAAPTMTPLAGN